MVPIGLQRTILFLAWRRKATGAPSGLPASGSATVQLSRLLDHGIERRDWSPRRGSKFHRRTPHKRRAARLWRVVRSFVRSFVALARARTRAYARTRSLTRRREAPTCPRTCQKWPLERAACSSCRHTWAILCLLKPQAYIRGNTRYAIRTSSRSTPRRTGMPPQ